MPNKLNHRRVVTIIINSTICIQILLQNGTHLQFVLQNILHIEYLSAFAHRSSIVMPSDSAVKMLMMK